MNDVDCMGCSSVKGNTKQYLWVERINLNMRNTWLGISVNKQLYHKMSTVEL